MHQFGVWYCTVRIADRCMQLSFPRVKSTSPSLLLLSRNFGFISFTLSLTVNLGTRIEVAKQPQSTLQLFYSVQPSGPRSRASFQSLVDHPRPSPIKFSFQGFQAFCIQTTAYESSCPSFDTSPTLSPTGTFRTRTCRLPPQ